MGGEGWEGRGRGWEGKGGGRRGWGGRGWGGWGGRERVGRIRLISGVQLINEDIVTENGGGIIIIFVEGLISSFFYLVKRQNLCLLLGYTVH